MNNISKQHTLNFIVSVNSKYMLHTHTQSVFKMQLQLKKGRGKLIYWILDSLFPSKITLGIFF